MFVGFYVAFVLLLFGLLACWPKTKLISLKWSSRVSWLPHLQKDMPERFTAIKRSLAIEDHSAEIPPWMVFEVFGYVWYDFGCLGKREDK